MSADYPLLSPAERARRCFFCLAFLVITIAGTYTGFRTHKADAVPAVSENGQAQPSLLRQPTPLVQLASQETLPSVLEGTAAQDISSLIPEELTMQEAVLEPVHDFSRHLPGDIGNGAHK